MLCASQRKHLILCMLTSLTHSSVKVSFLGNPRFSHSAILLSSMNFSAKNGWRILSYSALWQSTWTGLVLAFAFAFVFVFSEENDVSFLLISKFWSFLVFLPLLPPLSSLFPSCYGILVLHTIFFMHMFLLFFPLFLYKIRSCYVMGCCIISCNCI
jgi:hypothetical protein